MGELLRVHPANGRKSKTTLQRHPARKWFLTPTPISLPCRIRLFLRLWSSNSRKNQVILQLWFQCQKYHAVPPLPGKPSLQNIWRQQQLRKLSYQDWIKKVVTFQTNSLWVKPWFPLPNSPPPHQKKTKVSFWTFQGAKTTAMILFAGFKIHGESKTWGFYKSPIGKRGDLGANRIWKSRAL